MGIAFLYGGYNFYLGMGFALEKSRITGEGAYNAGGSLSQPTAIFEEENGPLYLFLNNSFENSGVNCDDVFDSLTAQFGPLSYQFPAFNATETPYSPSDFTGLAADGNAKGTFEKVCAKDPSTNFYAELTLLATAPYPTCKDQNACDWKFCRTSTLHESQPGGIVWNCNFQFDLSSSWPLTAVAGGNIEQSKKLWENLWIAMGCEDGYHSFCSEQDKSATAEWQTARIPLYAGAALLLVAVLMHCFASSDEPARDESPGVQLMS